MSFHGDMMDGINAFVAVRGAMKQDSRDAYYDWLLQNDPAYQIKKAKEEQDRRDKEAAKQKIAAQNAYNVANTPAPVSATGINAPAGGVPALPSPSGGFGAISTTPNSGTVQGQQSYFPNRGGMIPHSQAGGVQVPPVPGEPPLADPATGGLTPEQILHIRRMAEFEERARLAQRPPPQAIDAGDPNSLNRSSAASGYDPRRPPTTMEDASRYGQQPDEATLNAGRATGGAQRPTSAWERYTGAGAGRRPTASNYDADIEGLIQDRAALEPPMSARTTPEQRAEIKQRQDAINQRIDLLRGGREDPPVSSGQPIAPVASAGPAAPPMQTTPVTPQPPNTRGTATPQTPPVDPALARPDRDISPLGNASETAAARSAANRAGPGVGTGGSPGTEPPPGSIPIPGVGGPGGGGGGPGGGVGRRSARPKLGDQSRREAYDPTADAEDPNNVRPVFAGGAVNPVQYAKIQDAAKSFDTMLAGGTHFAEFLTRRGENHPHSEPSRLALHAGVGAMPVNSAQGIVAAWDMGGKLKPPDALIRYAMGTYEILVERGQTAAANQMAFEVIQRLNLEAARHGTQAMQALRQGDVAGAAKLVQDGHRWSPDGKTLQISPDGKYIGMTDQFTGKPTSPPIPITPKTLLAAALGLSDGSGMWNHLASRAQLYLQTQKGAAGDKDAEGRAIRNRNNIYRGEILRRKLDAPPKVVGASGPPPIMGQFRQTANTQQPSGGKTIIRQGSSEDDYGGAGSRDDVGSRDDDE